MKKYICRYDKDANTNLCPGCKEGCIERKPAVPNQEFEKAVKEMIKSNSIK